jgi:hypothetical protein
MISSKYYTNGIPIVSVVFATTFTKSLFLQLQGHIDSKLIYCLVSGSLFSRCSLAPSGIHCNRYFVLFGIPYCDFFLNSGISVLEVYYVSKKNRTLSKRLYLYNMKVWNSYFESVRAR